MIAGQPLYLADTSVITRGSRPGPIAERLLPMIRRGLIATCAPVDLEVGFSARTPASYAELAADRVKLFIELPLNDSIGDRARAVQALLARRSQHRVAGATDLLIAAAAEEHNAVLLHYDADFDAIAEVTGQRTEWIVPRGSAD